MKSVVSSNTATVFLSAAIEQKGQFSMFLTIKVALLMSVNQSTAEIHFGMNKPSVTSASGRLPSADRILSADAVADAKVS